VEAGKGKERGDWKEVVEEDICEGYGEEEGKEEWRGKIMRRGRNGKRGRRREGEERVN